MTTSTSTRKRFFSPLPPAWIPVLRAPGRAAQSLVRLFRMEAASGVLLLLAALVALVWVSSPWAASYDRLFGTRIGVHLGALSFERDLAFVINDGLMAVFFFVVGLEIRRELHDGELSSWRRAALPMGAALGGMLVPAAVYLALAGGSAARSGWGVPMATDIAFALAILTLLGRRIPPALRVLLLALAVIDDLGAIVVIAFFYSEGVAPWGLFVAGAGIAAILYMQRLGIGAKLAYAVPALVVWAGVYAAGIHPTIAGVAVGLITPVGRGATEMESPSAWLIEKLHPWVAFSIMPLFALANAGVTLAGPSLDAASWRVVVGVIAGLVIGKPAGVVLATLLLCRARLASLPDGISLRHIAVLAVVAGIGFTMSLFIAPLAFADPHLLAAAKLGVLVASAIAAAIAFALGRIMLRETSSSGAAKCGPPLPG